jgi:hypothetical protein
MLGNWLKASRDAGRHLSALTGSSTIFLSLLGLEQDGHFNRRAD